jgi:hypothetical protein
MAMSASASALIKNISLGIRNSSHTAIRVEICRNGDAREPRIGDSNSRPCSAITETRVVGSGQRYIVSNSNPVGVIITPRDCDLGFAGYCPDRRRLQFYTRNPWVGRPFFFTDNREIGLKEHQHDLGSQHAIRYELRRYADEDRDGEHVKLMRIEIQHWDIDDLP